MDVFTKMEGSAVNRAPLLVGSENYAWWKRRMMNFIKVMDREAWQSIVEGWTEASDFDGTEKEKDVIAAEKKAEQANVKALHYIEIGLNIEQSNMIASCTSAKDAWETLRNQYEGTPNVRRSKLIHLNSDFENLFMDEDESISQFHTRIKSVINEMACLGERIPENKVVQKVLRSLPERFDIKVTSLGDTVDTSTMRLDELMGSLKTHEMQLESREKRKGAAVQNKKVHKDLAFHAKVRGAANDNTQDDSQEISDDDLRALVSKISKKLGMKHDNSFKGREGKPKNEKKIQCHECKGFGHIAAKCANTLEKKKSMMVTLTDGCSSDSDSSASFGNRAFTVRMLPEDGSQKAYDSQPDSGSQAASIDGSQAATDSDVSSEDAETLMMQLIEKYEERYKKLKVSNAALRNENAEKDAKLKSVEKELLDAKEVLRKIGADNDKLNEILAAGRVEPEHKGLGYEGDDSSLSIDSVKTFNVSCFENQEVRPRIKVCHHCGKAGHIRPHCFKWQREQKRKSVQSVKAPVPVCAPASQRTAQKVVWHTQRRVVCHYCGRAGHIRPRCFALLHDLRIMREEAAQVSAQVNARPNKAWVKKIHPQVSIKDQRKVDALVKHDIAADHDDVIPKKSRGKELCSCSTSDSSC